MSRYLIASGNSNDPSIYDGGTLPASNAILRLNNFTLTVVANMTLAELRCDALAPAVTTTNVRSLILNNGVTLTCTSQFVGMRAADSFGPVNVQAVGTATIVSPLFLHNISGVQTGRVLNLVGNVSITLTSGGGSGASFHRGGGTVNITGNVVNTTAYFSDTIEGGTINVVGDIMLDGGAGFWIRGSHTFNCTGSITVTSIPLIDNSSTTYPVVSHIGPLNAGTVPAIRTRSPYYGTGPFLNNGEVMAFSGDRMRLSGTDNQWNMVTAGLAARSLRTAGLLTGYPLPADVESGVTYGPVGEFTGTLQPVVINTAQLATDLLTEMNTSNLTIAQGLRDGMGASAAAIAAVGSINVIP